MTITEARETGCNVFFFPNLGHGEEDRARFAAELGGTPFTDEFVRGFPVLALAVPPRTNPTRRGNEEFLRAHGLL